MNKREHSVKKVLFLTKRVCQVSTYVLTPITFVGISQAWFSTHPTIYHRTVIDWSPKNGKDLIRQTHKLSICVYACINSNCTCIHVVPGVVQVQYSTIPQSAKLEVVSWQRAANAQATHEGSWMPTRALSWVPWASRNNIICHSFLYICTCSLKMPSLSIETLMPCRSHT